MKKKMLRVQMNSKIVAGEVKKGNERKIADKTWGTHLYIDTLFGNTTIPTIKFLGNLYATLLWKWMLGLGWGLFSKIFCWMNKKKSIQTFKS